jgi:hypothetical protein
LARRSTEGKVWSTLNEAMNRHTEGFVQSNSGELSLAELYGLIRSQIEHENELVSQRVIWQILTQAFFFGAYASLLNAPKEAKNYLFESEQILLLWLMPIAAILAGLLAYISIVSSLKTIVLLRQRYEDRAHSKSPGDPSSKLYPDIQGPAQWGNMAMFSPGMMPLVFTVSWLVVLGRLVIAWW